MLDIINKKDFSPIEVEIEYYLKSMMASRQESLKILWYFMHLSEQKYIH
jgi:hypothetical protein